MLDIFSVAEPAQLPHVVSSPFMLKCDPAFALAHLDRLEAAGAPSVTLTLATASLALRMGDMQLYQQQMERHAEVRSTTVWWGVFRFILSCGSLRSGLIPRKMQSITYSLRQSSVLAANRLLLQ